MKTFLAVCILFGTLAVAVNGQDTCFAPSNRITLASTRVADVSSPLNYFVIGGMFDVHQKGMTAYNCSASFTDEGLINMLAFFKGIDMYYLQSGPSKSLSVGAIAFDNCLRPDQTIQNMYDYAQCRINVGNMQPENLVAYIGPYMNQDSELAGGLAEDLGITVFSPMADSNINSMDQNKLLKTRPSFLYDLKAIVEFLNKVSAKFVIILYSGKDSYWRAAYEDLTSLIKNSKTCIQYTADRDSQQINNIIDNLATRREIKYIIPLMSSANLKGVMDALFNKTINYIFLINSRIGRDQQLMTHSQSAVDGSIIIEPSEPSDFMELLTPFHDFLIGLQENSTIPGINDVNDVGYSWLKAYLRQKSFPELSISSVSSNLLFSVYRTLQSVKTIFKGMDTLLDDCKLGSNNYQLCKRNKRQANDEFYSYFKTAANRTYMNNSGDLAYEKIKYSYYIFSGGSGTKFTKTGDFIVDSTGGVSATINLKDLYFGSTFTDLGCQTGSGQCCEITTTSAPTTVAVTGGDGSSTTQRSEIAYSIVKYPTGQAITGAYSTNSSNRKDSTYGTRFDLGHKWIIALGVLAGLGILCVIVFEVYILYKLLGTPTGSKWRTMWLGQLLLFGVFLCYLVLFAYLPIQTKATCGITRFGVGVAYAFCFAVLLVKLMVILTSKPTDVLLPGDIETPNYLKGTYQFLLFLLSVGVQVVIDVQWLITVPPEAVLVTSNNGDKVWVCNHYTWQAGSEMDNMPTFVRNEFENHLMSLIYIMVMILITTILSLKAHGIITNHRESVFVGIASGFTIPIWLAWGLVGGLNKSHDYAQEFGDACIAFGLLITATLILFSMFLPKVRHLVNMGIEGIYLEDDRETIYGGSVILAPSSYKSKGSGSVIYVNNQGIYSEPVIVSNGDPMATHLKHPGSVYSVPGNYIPGNYIKNPESVYGGSTRVLRVTDDLRGRHPQKRSQSEVAYGSSRKPRSYKGTLPRSRSHTNLGAL